jgi:indoleamine 2,3-dioxygenase
VKALPQYDVSEIEDTHLLTGLFRDYAFATSAYMLEPCHLNFHKTGEYGLGRAVIPKNLSIPFWKIAEKLHARPFMEYAMSYILFNWKRKDPQGPIVFNNLETIRRCEGSQSESGFGIVHVTMDAFTGALVSETESILNAVAKKDVAAFNQHMQMLLVCMTDIN